MEGMDRNKQYIYGFLNAKGESLTKRIQRAEYDVQQQQLEIDSQEQSINAVQTQINMYKDMYAEIQDLKAKAKANKMKHMIIVNEPGMESLNISNISQASDFQSEAPPRQTLYDKVTGYLNENRLSGYKSDLREEATGLQINTSPVIGGGMKNLRDTRNTRATGNSRSPGRGTSNGMGRSSSPLKEYVLRKDETPGKDEVMQHARNADKDPFAKQQLLNATSRVLSQMFDEAALCKTLSGKKYESGY